MRGREGERERGKEGERREGEREGEGERGERVATKSEQGSKMRGICRVAFAKNDNKNGTAGRHMEVS